MGKRMVDPIIAELRAMCDTHVARFDHELAAIVRDIRAMQDMSGREHVRDPLPPPMVEPTVAMPESIRAPGSRIRSPGFWRFAHVRDPATSGGLPDHRP